MNSLLKIWKDTKYSGSFNLFKKEIKWHFNLSLWLKVLVCGIAFGAFFVGALDFQATMDGIGSPVKYVVSPEQGILITAANAANINFGTPISSMQDGITYTVSGGALDTKQFVAHVVDGKLVDLKSVTPAYAAAVNGWHQYAAITGPMIITGIVLSLTFSIALSVNFGMINFVEKKYGQKMATYAVIALVVLTAAALAGMIVGAVAYQDGKDAIIEGNKWVIVNKG